MLEKIDNKKNMMIKILKIISEYYQNLYVLLYNLIISCKMNITYHQH